MMYLVSAAVIALVCVAVFAARSEWERRQLKIEYYSVPRDAGSGGKNAGSGRADAGSGTVQGSPSSRLRLAFLSDIHNYLGAEGRIEAVARAVDEAAPDLVLVGGDAITVKKETRTLSDTAPFLELCGKLAEKYPVITANGNHEVRFQKDFPKEYRSYLEAQKKNGVVCLSDERVVFDRLAVSAVDLDIPYYEKHLSLFGKGPEMPEKYLLGKAGLPDPERFNILLLHSPLYLKEAAAWGADLVLSGHFHGGTIRLPGGRGLMTPQLQFFNKECSGQHRFGKTEMIVNRGLGTHSFNIRLNDLPEISIIDIYL